MGKQKEKEYDFSAFDEAAGIDFSAFDNAVKKKADSQPGGVTSSSGFAPSQDTEKPVMLRKPMSMDQATPVEGLGMYKPKTPVAKDIAMMDNFVGYMVDKVVKGGAKGAVSVPNFAGDLVATITSKLTGTPMVYSGYTLAGPSFLPIGDEKWKNAIIQGRDMEQKEGIDKLGVLSSKKYEEDLNKSAEQKGIFSPQFVGSSIGSLAESVGMGLTTGGAGFYTSIIEDSYLDAKKKGLSDGEAFAYGSTVGAVNGALEKYGMDALLKGMPKSVKDKVSKYVTNKVLSKLTKSGVELTEDVIEKTIAQEVKGLYQVGLKVGAKGIYNAATEGSTELGQEIATYTAEKVVNTLKGKEIFKQEDTPMRFAQAFFGGAFGGGAVGSVAASFGKGESYDYIKQKIAETKNDDAKYDAFRQDIADDLVHAGVDEAKITQAIASIDAMREKQKSIPDTVPAEAIDAVTELQETRDKLHAQIEEINAQQVDPAFAKSNELKVATLQGSIDATNDAIAAKSGDKIIYRQTEKGFERDVDGRVEPISKEQFDYADANNLEGIDIEHDISDQKEGEKPKTSPTNISSVKIKSGVELTDKQKADLKDLEDKGWTKSKGEDGSTIYTKPKEVVEEVTQTINGVKNRNIDTSIEQNKNIEISGLKKLINDGLGKDMSITPNEVAELSKLEFSVFPQNEIDKSDTTKPIILIRKRGVPYLSISDAIKNAEEEGDSLSDYYEIVDGRHRIKKAINEGKGLNAVVITEAEYEKATNSKMYSEETQSILNEIGVNTIEEGIDFLKDETGTQAVDDLETLMLEKYFRDSNDAGQNVPEVVEPSEDQQNELADIEATLQDPDLSEQERATLEARKAELAPPKSTKQDTKAQIEQFGVAKEDVEPVHGVVSQLFNGLKKAGLTAAKTVGDWVNIGKGKEKPYALKINGKEVQVKNLSPEVVNGFYSPLEKIISDSKFDKLPAKQWIDKFARGEEAKWTGLTDWLSKQPGSVSKADIQQFLKDNRIQVVEVVKGGEDSIPYLVDWSLKKFDKDDYNATIGSDETIEYVLEDDEAGYEIIKTDESYYVRDKFGENIFKDGDYNNKIEILPDAKEVARMHFFGENQPAETKYQNYQTEGKKENYKEILVTLPFKKELNNTDQKELDELYSINSADRLPKQNKRIMELLDKVQEAPSSAFSSSHWEEPNILVHLRMNTRTDADGKKVLFLEEVQSDWGQQGKKAGFKKPENTQAIKELENEKQKVLDSSKSYQLLNSKTEGNLTKEVFDAIQQQATANIDNKYFTDQSRKERFLEEIENTLGYWSNHRYQTPIMTQNELSDFYDVYIEELKNNSNKKTGYGTSYQIADIENKIQDINKKIEDFSEKTGLPQAPFVTDTNSWAKLGLKVALKEAIKQGADKIAWTTGEQQNERYDLSNTLETVDITRLDSDGNRFVYIMAKNASDGLYKIDSNGKVLDSGNNQLTGNINGKNLEDVIGKELTSKVLEANDGDRLSGEDFKIGGKGMKGFYGSPKEGSLGIIGNVAKSLFKQEPKTTQIKNSDEYELGEANYVGGIGVYNSKGDMVAEFDTQAEATDFIKSKSGGAQHSIDITPELRASVEEGQPLFKKGDAQYRVESGKNIIEAIKNFNGSPKAIVALTHEIMHPTVVAIVDGAKEGNEIGVKHATTIVDEFNKANPKNKITIEDLISGNDSFKEGSTNEQYRAVQEFIAKSWERYHREGGRGFSVEFQKVLDQITKAFQSVYKSLSGKKITPELRKMFDEILGNEQQIIPTTVDQFAQAQKLYQDMMATESGAKRSRLNKERQAFLEANPRVKEILEIIPKLEAQLGERLTKEGNCP
jgi:hypothetical protein